MEEKTNSSEPENKDNNTVEHREPEQDTGAHASVEPSEDRSLNDQEKAKTDTIYPEPTFKGPDLKHPETEPENKKTEDQEGRPANTPGLLVLQWLTYAFWGWALVALCSLVAAVTIFYVAGGNTEGFTPYAVAALVVLLPLAFISDLYYSKKEPGHKGGGAMVIMIIHAVLFALVALGSFITAVFVLVSMLTDYGNQEERLTIIITALVVAILNTLTFIRTLNPEKFKSTSKHYRLIMVGVVGLVIVLAFAGPVLKERSLRDDKLIERELPSLSRAIDDYANDNDELPESLQALSVEDQTKTLVEKNLVEYKPDTRSEDEIRQEELSSSLNDALNNQSSSSRGTSYLTRQSDAFYYQLCVNYKEKSENYGEYSYSSSYDPDDYSTYISTYDHPEGRVCYKVKTRDYNY